MAQLDFRTFLDILPSSAKHCAAFDFDSTKVDHTCYVLLHNERFTYLGGFDEGHPYCDAFDVLNFRMATAVLMEAIHSVGNPFIDNHGYLI